MPTNIAVAASVAALTAPLKDLYEFGKDKFKDQLSKLVNSKNVKLLATKVSAYEQVKTIWQRDKAVKLSKFYYPAKVSFDTGITKTASSLNVFPPTGGVVIQGTVGQGKSVLLRYLCIQELSSHASGRIPIFFELKKLDSNLNIEKALKNTLESLGFQITDDLFECYAKSGKLVILLDGFDEIDASLVNNTITTLEFWALKFPLMQFIITSRPAGEIQKSNHFTIIKLAPLTQDEHRPFLAKIGVKGEELNLLITAIEASPNEISELLTTPLLLTLLIMVYQSQGVIPNELPEFFKLLFNTVFIKHDRTKPAFNRQLKSGLNERKLERCFEAFCFAVLRRNYSVNLKNDQLQTVFDDALTFSGENCTLDGFKHDVIKVACLLQEDGLYTSFVHKSLLDYFPAAFIKNCTDEQSLRIYEAIAPNWEQWQYVLNFLAYIDKYRFAKYFAIPHIKSSLIKVGAVNGKITKELAQRLIEGTFDQHTYFKFVFQPEFHEFFQVEFYDYHDILDNYFFSNFNDGFRSLANRFECLSNLDCKFTVVAEYGSEYHHVYCKELMTPEILISIEKDAVSILAKLVDRLNKPG